MCGRYKQTSPLGTLAQLYGLTGPVDGAPAGIVAPGMTAPVVTGGFVLERLAWGFVPAWSKEDLKTKIINARRETLGEKPSFRQAKRCLVPADGFFEWDQTTKPKRAYNFSVAGSIMFGGLWDEWTHPLTCLSRRTFAIVTVAARAPVAALHDRMPLIFSRRASMAAWLNMETNDATLNGDSIMLDVTPAHFPKSARAGEAAEENRQLSLF